MFAGYKIDIGIDYFSNNDYKLIFEEQVFKKQKKQIEISLNKYIGPDGNIQGSDIINDWFPEIKADVFISHSHKDIELVKAFAGMLYDNFGIYSFVDSFVWEYADDLLKNIDDKYCYKEASKAYDYNIRNRSTAHVHMMLNSALINMIDCTECLFFVNTPNSISTNDIKRKEQVGSPWIYSELLYSRVLRQVMPDRLKKKKKSIYHMDETAGVSQALTNVRYDITTDHLINLTQKELTEWIKGKNGIACDSLDRLYLLTGVIGGNNFNG